MSQEPVSTVFAAPAPVSCQVGRPRLEELLGPATGARLSVIVGPAGSGKSVLARSWLENCSTGWCWFALEPAAADDPVFTECLIRAVQRAFPDDPLCALEVVGDDQFEPTKAMAALIDDLVHLDRRGRSGVVVIDGAHLLSPRAWDNLAWFVSHQPGCMHLVLVTRSDPPLPLAQLRAYGRLTEVHSDDLAFTEDEAVELFSRFAQDRTDADDWPALAPSFHDRTAGWAAGLRLALAALQRGEPPRRLLTEFGGTKRTVADLLLEEVLEHQPDDIRRFLRITSAVTTLEPALCDALTGRDDSRAVLRQLARDHVLIYQLDGAVDTYRCHPMFADLLQHELRVANVDEEASVNARASHWFEGHGRVAESIEHTLRGGDFERVLRHVTHHRQQLRLEGHRADIGRWLTALPDDFVLDDPRSAIDHCATLTMIEHRSAWPALRKVLRTFDSLPPDLRATTELLLGIQSASKGQQQMFDEHMERCRALQPPRWDEPLQEVAAAWESALLSIHGRHENAVERAVTLLRSDRQVVVDSLALAGVASALYAAGDAAARHVAGDAIEAWRAAGEPEVPGVAGAFCIASAYSRSDGDRVGAERLMSAVLPLLDEQPMDLLTVYVWLEQAKVEHMLGRSDEARERVDSIHVRARLADLAPTIMRTVYDIRQELDDSDISKHESVVRPPETAELTDRELTILRHLVSELTFTEIGLALYISRNTVKTHALRVYRKLGVSSRAAAIDEAYRRGLLSLANELVPADDGG